VSTGATPAVIPVAPCIPALKTTHGFRALIQENSMKKLLIPLVLAALAAPASPLQTPPRPSPTVA